MIAALAYAALSTLLVMRWRTRMQGSLLLVACVVSAIWAIAGAFGVVGPLADAIHLSVWLLFLTRVVSATVGTRETRQLRWSVHAAAVVLIALGIIGGVLRGLGRLPDAFATAQVYGLLLLALLGFLLLDQVMRNTRAAKQWIVKLVWVGVGGIFFCDVVLYATVLMLGEAPQAFWDARGIALASLALPIAAGVSRIERWTPQLFVSRKFVVYSAGFVGAGLFLVTLSLVGFYLRSYGGTWGGAAQLVVLFGGLVALVVLLLSNQARGRMQVFVSKHLYPHRRDFREEWLGLVKTMTAPEEDLSLPERACTALGQVLNAAPGGCWLRHENRQFVPSGGELAPDDAGSEPIDGAFGAFVQDRDWIVDLDDERRQPGVSGCPVPPWLLAMPRARYVVPLITRDALIGFVVTGRAYAEGRLTWEELDLARVCARQVASYLELEKSAAELALSRQFEAYNRLTAFIMHDLKNLIAQQQLVVRNAVRHKGNPEFVDDAIATIDNSVQRMTRLLEQLRRHAVDELARTHRVRDLCDDAIQRCGGRKPVPRLSVSTDEVCVNLQGERLVAVLVNLLRNAQEATAESGSVEIEVRQDARFVRIEIVDTGAGMDATFVRDRLFRPFDSTKGTQGMGVGAYQAREFVRSVGGDVDVNSTPGEGTRFVLRVPAAACL